MGPVVANLADLADQAALSLPEHVTEDHTPLIDHDDRQRRGIPLAPRFRSQVFLGVCLPAIAVLRLELPLDEG